MVECRICGWKGNAEFITAKEMMYGTGEEFDYFVCPECNCLQIHKIPEDLGRFYAADYYSYANRDGRKTETEQKQFTKILDVGCGSGAWLCNLAAAGYVNLTGCDPFIEKDLHYDNGVNIYKKTIHEMDGLYDQIYMNDSFEHVTDPHEVMDSICRLLGEKGVARIAIPVYPNIAYEMFGADWYQLDAPRHIFLHSVKSMKYLAQKHKMKVVRVDFNSNAAQIVRSFLYAKGIPFIDQTKEVYTRYFNAQTLNEIEQNSELANQNQLGDHAVFYLVADNTQEGEV